MMQLSEIRKDLKDIRYYYSRQKLFDEGFRATGHNEIMEKVQKYNDAISSAPLKLYDVYYSLYVKNHTQESFSDELGYTPEYIQMLNKKLLKFFQAKFSV